MMNKLLDAPCRWCGYNGEMYWQAHSHADDCPWYEVGGGIRRETALPGIIDDAIKATGIPKGYVLMPIEPTLKILTEIVVSDWPNDSDAGHRLQSKRGLAMVPPNSELECAVGTYERMIKVGAK
jgi:hypothetical protein